VPRASRKGRPGESGGPPVLYEKRDAIAEVALNRPRRFNAYDTAMRDALFEALGAIGDDPEVEVMILHGTGPAFSTGGDLAEFGSAPSAVAAREIRWLRDVWGRLWNLPQITIAAVHGYTIGGGLEMMLLCDLCIADPGTRMFLPETGRGMIPGVAGTQTLPRLLGTARALDLCLGGTEIDAASACRLGLCAEVAPAGEVLARARQRARQLCNLEPRLRQATKQLVRDALDLDLTAGLRRERQWARACASTAT